VLVVDDMAMNRKMLKRKFLGDPFEELEWQVETAKTAEEALTMIEQSESEGDSLGSGRSRNFDLVVFDQRKLARASEHEWLDGADGRSFCSTMTKECQSIVKT